MTGTSFARFAAAMVVACVGVSASAQDVPSPPQKNPPKMPTRQPPSLPDDFPSSLPATIADRIGKTHNERAWHAHDAFTCDITVEFGGVTMLDGSMLIDINGDRVRFDLVNGTVLLWDGKQAWVSPADSQFESAHYHLHMWPSLLKLPFELKARGTKTKEEPVTTIDTRVLNTLHVTFDESSKRVTPKDWQIVYSDLVTHALYGMAFISTYGKTIEDAEREAQMVLFEDPAIVNQVVIPRTWSFYHWNKSQGKYGPKLGTVRLTNLNFSQLRKSAFEKPDGAREDVMPVVEDEHADEEPTEPTEPARHDGD